MHLEGNCPKEICDYCSKPGHSKEHCKNGCFMCKDPKHPAGYCGSFYCKNCDEYVHRANNHASKS